MLATRIETFSKNITVHRNRVRLFRCGLIPEVNIDFNID